MLIINPMIATIQIIENCLTSLGSNSMDMVFEFSSNIVANTRVNCVLF